MQGFEQVILQEKRKLSKEKKGKTGGKGRNLIKKITSGCQKGEVLLLLLLLTSRSCSKYGRGLCQVNMAGSRSQSI